MIKLLLVDDEPIIRRGIRTSIDWEEYGIGIVGEAANGAEALDRSLQLKPQIVVTDIRMPCMDGLELSRHLRNQLPDTRIVILSGYEDFSYAREALSIGVQNYLLKPVGAEELVTVLKQLKVEIEQLEAGKRNRLSRDLVFNENYPAIKSDFINRIVKGGIIDPNTVYERAELLNIRLIGQQYAMVVIDIDDFTIMTEDLPPAERELLRFSVMNVAEELLLSKTSGVICYSEFDHLIGLLCGDKLTPEFVGSLCADIRSCVRKYLKLSVSIGIGRTRGSIADLDEVYAEAFAALKTKIFKGKDSQILYEEADSALPQAVLYPSEEEKAIVGCLKTLDTAGLTTAIDQIFDRFVANRTDVGRIRSICGRMILVSASGIEEMGFDTGSVIGADFNPYREMERFDTLKDLQGWINSLLQRLSDLVQENKNRKFKGIIKTALRYMEENYARDLSLAEVAAVVYVTPNYLSRIFKEEMGLNFVEWLNRSRVEKAKTLLAEPGAKTYSIAEKVGYSDYKYFSQMFKRFVGFSPKEYKEFKSQ
ncbi:DNA-binding response regulator [Cohnella endophytica]|uniref:DNA-binding response regulator n=1 Tax=Cohnella endophytica TaxID=2419778 RepID=A0A494X7P4_9BACL|nr:response regulator transcription factor [Cohnella endophytica]RKP46745.1 DNA-binding response regulator [Cohnella endophytica]